MKVAEIEYKLSEVLQDTDQDTWTSPQLWGWLLDAELAVVLMRPDASQSTERVALVAGAQQGVGAVTGAQRVLDVLANVGAAGEPGPALRRTARGALDAFDPNWYLAGEVTQPDEYLFDDRMPKQFLVNPPADGAGYVSVVCSIAPAAYDLNNRDTLISVDDSYVPALIEWALYRAWSRDSEMTPNWQRAQAHRQAFFDLMGVKSNSDIATSLKRGGQLD